MTGLNILVVDDDPNVHEIIRIYFESQQFHMTSARDAASAMKMIESNPPDMIIMDVMMPGMDGYEACRTIQSKWNIPIIMLTAKGEEFDRVLGLELGADDYMTKPFSPRELISRIKAIYRRSHLNTREMEADSKTQDIHFEGLSILLDRREVVADGISLEFRPKEYELLVHLAKAPGHVYTRDQLLEQVWGYDFFGDHRTVDVHVKKIRDKLHSVQKEYIQTVWGVGYKFEAGS